MSHIGRLVFLVSLLWLGFSAPRAQVALAAIPTDPIDSLFVAMVPAGFPVNLDLLTDGNRQFIAYYNSDHSMVVGSRTLDSDKFSLKVLPTKIGWDPHNYVVIELDDQGHLHVSGNMHAVPLIYFRTEVAGDISTLVQVPNMVSKEREARVTYPRFFKMPTGELYFVHRLGGSGDGVWYYNKYDSRPDKRSWSSLYNGAPLFSNAGSVNAYFGSRYHPGDDGRFHISFVWRDSPDVSSTHDLSYIRTRGPNLDAWETARGEPLSLPITVSEKKVSVDPVPTKQGLTNQSNQMGFDSKGRPVISYHRYDSKGISQAYNARWSEAKGAWDLVQTSDWKDYTWKVGGTGSLPKLIVINSVIIEDGKLTQYWDHPTYGSGKWILNEETLKPTATIPLTSTPGGGEGQVKAGTMEIRFQFGRGKSDEPGIFYALRRYTLPANGTNKPNPVPPDTRLMLLKFRDESTSIRKASILPPLQNQSKIRFENAQVNFIRFGKEADNGSAYDTRGRSRLILVPVQDERPVAK